MKKNMGNIDRIARVSLAVIFSVLFFMDMVSGTLGIILLVVSGAFFITSVASYCPIYAILGLNSCKTGE